MNNEKFIEAIRHHVLDAAIEDTIANLKNPPGRRVAPHERAASDWYNSLKDDEITFVNSTVTKAVHEGLFGLLAVLDGARTIDDGAGKFELIYASDQRILLNDPKTIGLHDLLNASN